MTSAIDDYLDGVLERTALPPHERAEADLVRHAIAETRDYIDARPVPDLTAGVMRQIEQAGSRQIRAPRGPFTQLMSGLWNARHVSFQFRPAYGLAAAAAVITLTVLAPPGWRLVIERASPAALTVDPTVFVQFRLQAPEAETVQLAGSFTNWQPRFELHEMAPGLWTITLPLASGVHDYAFIVDGQRWVADPYAPAVADGFGGTSSRLTLLPPEEARL